MLNILHNNIVVNPSEELTPFISIAALDRNKIWPELLTQTPNAINYFDKRFGKNNYTITPKARIAITIVLEELKLNRDDVVTILTTSGSSYISSCVTKAIEKVCKWSREITDKTRVLLVNHEFGYAFTGLSNLKQLGYPIVEDCAHSFFTQSSDIGKVGDYVIYSLPKCFSTQMGGVIIHKDSIIYKPDKQVVKYVLSSIESQIGLIDYIVKKRFENYYYYCSQLKDIGIKPFFSLKDGDVPGAFMFTWNKKVDYLELKRLLNSNGVDSSKFFGNEAYFVPVHHNLAKQEIDYICSLIRYFYKSNI